MRTTFQTPKDIEAAFLKIAHESRPFTDQRPERFIRMMQIHTGFVAAMTPYGLDEDGLERKNPLIVAMGDSVTAGHFEMTIPLEEFFRRVSADPQSQEKRDLTDVEIVDVRESYPERFRMKLIDHFKKTSVSLVNCGIAGDTIFGMHARLHRDVIRYQPDLVIFNGALNWSPALGDKAVYKEKLRAVVRDIKEGTEADLILVTPNMMIVEEKESVLPQQVEAIREIAVEEDVCIADAYALWEEYVRRGFPLEAVLSNGLNHPSVTGHEVYAIALMKLITE